MGTRVSWTSFTWSYVRRVLPRMLRPAGTKGQHLTHCRGTHVQAGCEHSLSHHTRTHACTRCDDSTRAGSTVGAIAHILIFDTSVYPFRKTLGLPATIPHLQMCKLLKPQEPANITSLLNLSSSLPPVPSFPPMKHWRCLESHEVAKLVTM